MPSHAMIHPTDIGDTLPQEIGTTTLPTDFPQNTPVPAFTLGDRVRWKPIDSDPTDFGTIIGFFYAYADRLQHWHWKYLIFLDPTSESHTFCLADTAWENHLEHHEHTAPTGTERNRTHPEICQLSTSHAPTRL
jgi:hypothetical protein